MFQAQPCTAARQHRICIEGVQRILDLPPAGKARAIGRPRGTDVDAGSGCCIGCLLHACNRANLLCYSTGLKASGTLIRCLPVARMYNRGWLRPSHEWSRMGILQSGLAGTRRVFGCKLLNKALRCARGWKALMKCSTTCSERAAYSVGSS